MEKERVIALVNAMLELIKELKEIVEKDKEPEIT
jgi:hypothetical protein